MESKTYLIVCRSMDGFMKLHPTVPHVVGDMDFGLSGSGDCVRLFTDDGTLVDDVCYGVTLPWPEIANGGGATLALTHPFADNSNPENWYALTSNGNPGEENQLVSGVEGTQAESRLTNYPNPFNSQTTIQYSLDKPGIARLTLHDQQGKLVKVLRKEQHVSGIHELGIDLNGLSGMFFIRLESNDGVFVRKIVGR